MIKSCTFAPFIKDFLFNLSKYNFILKLGQFTN